MSTPQIAGGIPERDEDGVFVSVVVAVAVAVEEGGGGGGGGNIGVEERVHARSGDGHELEDVGEEEVEGEEQGECWEGVAGEMGGWWCTADGGGGRLWGGRGYWR